MRSPVSTTSLFQRNISTTPTIHFLSLLVSSKGADCSVLHSLSLSWRKWGSGEEGSRKSPHSSQTAAIQVQPKLKRCSPFVRLLWAFTTAKQSSNFSLHWSLCRKPVQDWNEQWRTENCSTYSKTSRGSCWNNKLPWACVGMSLTSPGCQSFGRIYNNQQEKQWALFLLTDKSPILWAFNVCLTLLKHQEDWHVHWIAFPDVSKLSFQAELPAVTQGFMPLNVSEASFLYT